MATSQTAVFLEDKMLAKAMTTNLEKVEGKYVLLRPPRSSFPKD